MSMNCPKCKKNMVEGETFEDPEGMVCTEYYCRKCRKHYTDVTMTLEPAADAVDEDAEIQYEFN